MGNTETYYHYTTPGSAEAIMRDKVIRMSTQDGGRRNDARYGNGVYLTKIPPSRAKEQIAFNNYDGLIPSVAHLGTSCFNNFLV